MIHDRDIDLMAELSDRHMAVDALGLILYHRKGPRFFSFRMAFLAGLEDYETGHWLEARGTGPAAIGNNLAATWSERTH